MPTTAIIGAGSGVNRDCGRWHEVLLMSPDQPSYRFMYSTLKIVIHGSLRCRVRPTTVFPVTLVRREA
jgi:hypothetical protein